MPPPGTSRHFLPLDFTGRFGGRNFFPIPGQAASALLLVHSVAALNSTNRDASWCCTDGGGETLEGRDW